MNTDYEQYQRLGEHHHTKQGDRVRFWTNNRPLDGVLGTALEVSVKMGCEYAKIQPDDTPDRPVYLFRGAVWGYQPVSS